MTRAPPESTLFPSGTLFQLRAYFDFREPLRKLPSPRILALFRGEKEEILDLQLQPEAPAAAAGASGCSCKSRISSFSPRNSARMRGDGSLRSGSLKSK